MCADLFAASSFRIPFEHGFTIKDRVRKIAALFERGKQCFGAFAFGERKLVLGNADAEQEAILFPEKFEINRFVSRMSKDKPLEGRAWLASRKFHGVP